MVRVDVDAFASELWRKVLRDKRRPGMLSRRHLEVCVFSYLAAELRSGDIAVTGSDSYANLHAQLMSWDECTPLVEEFCAQAGIPTEASELVAFYKRRLTGTAARVDAGYPSNTDLVLDGGTPVLKRASRRGPAAGGVEAGGRDPRAATASQPARRADPGGVSDRVVAALRAGIGLGPEDP